MKKIINKLKKVYELIENKPRIISNLTIIEVITVLNVKLKQNPNLIKKINKDLNNNQDIVNDTSFHLKGFKILRNEFKKNKKRLPLFDCAYIAIMQDLGIKEIVSFDEHFDNKENISRIH